MKKTKTKTKTVTIPFFQAMAEQEAATNGKYTGTHWRDTWKEWKKKEEQ